MELVLWDTTWHQLAWVDMKNKSPQSDEMKTAPICYHGQQWNIHLSCSVPQLTNNWPHQWCCSWWFLLDVDLHTHINSRLYALWLLCWLLHFHELYFDMYVTDQLTMWLKCKQIMRHNWLVMLGFSVQFFLHFLQLLSFSFTMPFISTV